MEDRPKTSLELANEALLKHQLGFFEPLLKSKLPRPDMNRSSYSPEGKETSKHLEAMRHHKNRGEYHTFRADSLERSGGHDYDTASTIERHRQAAAKHAQMFEAHSKHVKPYDSDLANLTDLGDADYQPHPHDKHLKG